MSYVKDTDILDATSGGLDIITAYYPNAEKVLSKVAKQFKVRESEKTASASLKQLDNGVWVVTDFGGDHKQRNGIQICSLEENIPYGEACAMLGARYNVKGAEIQYFKPVMEQRKIKTEEIPNSKTFVFKDFTDKELALLGPEVNGGHCDDFKLKSCESITHISDKEVTIISSTEDFPIFVFDFGNWQKIYQPFSEKKGFRFSYAGDKPKRHLFGLDVIKKEYARLKKKQEDDYEDVDDESDEDEKATKKRRAYKLEAIFIMSGGSDGLNIRSFGKFPVWGNSETDLLSWEEYKDLKTMANDIYYVADLDNTGITQAIKMGLKFLDVKLLFLPNKLTTLKDKRGNPCKDFKDYVTKFYNPKESSSFTNGLDKLISNALPLQFWTEWFKAGKMNYNLSNTRLYQFLALMGFGLYEDKTSSEGYVFVKKEGSVVKKVFPYQIAKYVHSFLEDRGMSPEIRDYMYNSPKLNDKSLSNLSKVEIDFTASGRDYQYVFFSKKVWKVTAKEIIEYNQGEVNKFIWEDKVIDFKPKIEDTYFKIEKDKDGDLNIIINKKDNIFFNYLINTSRVHWRKDLEDSFKGKSEKEMDAYFKENQFNIEAPNLSESEVLEQKLHLINKIYSIGYLLHQYKDMTKTWCVFAMDNKVSENGESHGGSGKSLCYSTLNYFLRRFYIEGRNQKNVESEFVYHGVDENTDYILIDDASQYLKFENYFSPITGSLKVNPKNGVPFEIEFSKSPKFVIASNFTIRNPDPSTIRRVLFTVFSDYYHYNKDNEYNQQRQVSDDFGGKNLFKDFTEKDWNEYINFCMQCLQFYLSHQNKVDPPMDNVTKRSLQAEMGDGFIGWADAFFSTIDVNPVTFKDTPKYLDNYFSKEIAFEEFKKATHLHKWSTTQFKKAIKAYCQYNNYIFNPKELQNSVTRIVQNIGGKTQEVFYIRTIENVVTTDSNVKEYDNEDEIFN